MSRLASMWRYYLDAVLFPIVAAIAIAADCRSVDWLAWCALGIAGFTFVEYWTHRVLLHVWLFHGHHERHHKEPHEYVALPVWFTPAIFAGFFVLMPYAVFAGFVLGYLWFFFWHHVLHHWDLRHPWALRYAAWHMLHHRRTTCNYGITHPLWDVLFGTYRAAI